VPSCPHPCELAFPVQRRVAAVIRMKAHAPATPEDAVVLLDQPGEHIPARLIESLDRVPRPHHQLSLAASTHSYGLRERSFMSPEISEASA
jgi:hypothetical protein